MIDKWIKEDLNKIYSQHRIAVFINSQEHSAFLLDIVKKDYQLYEPKSEIDELFVKYLIEKSQPEKVLIYTQTKKEELKFIREYCETCGYLEILNLENYVKNKIHRLLNLNLNLSNDELITATKISVGKDKNYWLDICNKGASEIFDLSKELLPFIHDPDAYAKEKYDAQIRESFYQKVNILLGQNYLLKPPATLSTEIVTAMLDGLAENSCHPILETVYKSWLDSVSYYSSFSGYLKKYKIKPDTDIWQVNTNHPFREIDDIWLAETGKNLHNPKLLKTITEKIKQRSQSKQAQTLGISFWDDVLNLLAFDPKNMNYFSSLNDCTDFYIKHFYKLDTAIRNLYNEFLNKRSLLEPLQNCYQEYVAVFLDKWFKYWAEYKETQTGTLQRIISESGTAKTAIIVGDGIAYELAEQIAKKLDKTFKLKKDIILADIPSVTENNMSRIYMDNKITEAVHKKREQYLQANNPDVSIDFIKLDAVNQEPFPGQFLICTYKDIDDLGEKMQQKALKYFTEATDFFAEKIKVLLGIGYVKVYLISDHGFVLTGILSEADKVSPDFQGVLDKSERYIRSKNKQTNIPQGMIEIHKAYKEFNYLYFSTNLNPYKTTGQYGFSHGGLSPQELITPCFCWERSEPETGSLNVCICNKKEMKNITGNVFSLKIQSGEGSQDIFSANRQVYLMFFADKTSVNKSDIISLIPNQTVVKEYTFDNHTEFEIHLLDAVTHQQLDKVLVKLSKDRDLGGLL